MIDKGKEGKESKGISMEGSSENLACENESSDESLLMVEDEKSLSGQVSNATYEASNDLISSQDNELVTQLQVVEIINATQISNGKPLNQLLEKNLAEVQDLGIGESTREAEEHSLQVHVQEQAQSKVEPLGMSL